MQVLKGKIIELRAMEPADIDLLYDWENDTETWNYSNTYTPFSRFFLEQYVLNSNADIFTDKQLRLMIVNNLRQTIGCIDLFDFDAKNRRVGLGVLVAKPFRMKGYASEALDVTINYAQKVLNLHQLYCNITSDNPGSVRLFTGKGFQKCGTKKHWLLDNQQKWLNEEMYQLIFMQ